MERGNALTLKVTNTSPGLTAVSGSVEDTIKLARALGAVLPAGACVALYGDLGAGKTVFARGLIHGLGVADDVAVTSPTFVIVSEYSGRVPIHHVDAYRLAGAGDIVELGSREMFFSDAVSIVEWPERIEGALADERLDVRLAVAGESVRTIELAATGKTHVEALAKLASGLA
jgi:tRNA threonylcarbamoyladenosine biosynthesis protein TsaE